MTSPLGAIFWVHTVTVEPYLGVLNSQPAYGDPVDVVGFFDSAADLDLSAADTEATSAKSVFYTDPDNASLFPLNSRVTSDQLGGDGKATVILANSMTSGPLGLPDHLVVGLI